MIFASYTRNNSRHGDSLSALEQKKKITEYARQHHFSVSSRFVDRKEDELAEDAFFEMKNAGISRQFDCIVFWSIMHFGKDAMDGINLLSHAFLPCGLHFISVEDDFVSFERTDKEIEEYLEKKYKLRRLVSHDLDAFRERRKNSLYGYKKENGVYVIDDLVAPVVHSIFQMFLDGKTVSQIKKHLDDGGIVSPPIYMKGGHRSGSNDLSATWTTGYIRRMLKDARYTGIWNQIKLPPYISEEEHKKIAQKIIESSRKNSAEKFSNNLQRLIFDEETKLPLYICNYLSDNRKSYKLSIPNNSSEYTKRSIPVDDVEKAVMKVLEDEMQKAKRILSLFGSAEWAEALHQKEKPTIEKAQAIFEKMLALADENMPVCRDWNDDMFAQLDEQLCKAKEEVELIRKAFSPDNPWVVLYSGFIQGEELSLPLSEKYIEKVLVYRFDSVRVVMKNTDWKEMLPAEWMD